VSAKLTPEICINNFSSNNKLTAAARQSQPQIPVTELSPDFFFFFLPTSDEKTTELHVHAKNLLKLYCIWTWDTWWGFVFCFLFFWGFFCAVFLYFMRPLWWDNYRTTSEPPSPGLKTETDNKIIKTETSLHLNMDSFLFIYFFITYFAFCFILFLYISLSFTYFSFLFLSLFFLFFFNPLSVSLMPVQLTVD
jgi:hypothetical protein